jgi:glucose/arabinose dehydrogenase
MKRVGAETESANRITLLRDTNYDGIAGPQTIRRDSELALRHDAFKRHTLCRQYRRHRRLPLLQWPDSDNGAAGKNRRSSRRTDQSLDQNVIASRDGSKLYVSVGSNSNVGNTAWWRKKAAPAVWRTISQPTTRGSSPRDCESRTDFPGIRSWGRSFLSPTGGDNAFGLFSDKMATPR